MQRQHFSHATSTLGNTPNLNIGSYDGNTTLGSYTKGKPYIGSSDLDYYKAKGLTFPEPHKPVTAKKICVWQWSNEDTFPLEITHVRDDECERTNAI